MMDWWERKDAVSLSVADIRMLDRVLQEVREDFALMLALPDPSMALLTPECYYNEVLRRFYKLKNE